jgi:hypothetical protein
MSIQSMIEELASRTPVPDLPPIHTATPFPLCARCREINVVMDGDHCELCRKELEQGYEARTMTGRCANGAQRDSGVLYHAVRLGEWQAVCGAKHGRRSRWSEYHGESVTCKRCLKRLEAKNG